MKEEEDEEGGGWNILTRSDSWNKLRLKGAVAFLNGLMKNSTLKSLDIRHLPPSSILHPPSLPNILGTSSVLLFLPIPSSLVSLSLPFPLSSRSLLLCFTHVKAAGMGSGTMIRCMRWWR